MKYDALAILSQFYNRYVSRQFLLDELNITLDVLEDIISSLSETYSINFSEDEGYMLTGSLVEKNSLFLRTEYIGKVNYQYCVVDSTNDIAKMFAHLSAPDGTLIISKEQVKGKGTFGREWESPVGGLWMSILLRPDIPLHVAPFITLATGVAVSRTLNDDFGIDARIKWPNDILIDGKKVCGVLTESQSSSDKLDYLIVGVGLNTNVELSEFPTDLQNRVTSLSNEINKKFDELMFIDKFLMNFEEIYNDLKKLKLRGILSEWRSRTMILGEYVEILSNNSNELICEGYAVGIDDDGFLVVRTDGGVLEKVSSGTCVIKNP